MDKHDQYPWSQLYEISNRPTLRGHWQIMRLDHWQKNVFALPGIVVAIAFSLTEVNLRTALSVLIGMICLGLIASSNYVLNELLDSPFDRWHYSKKSRPFPDGRASAAVAIVQWLGLLVLGIFAGLFINTSFVSVIALLWMMGCVYNIPPVRTKDWPYLDVATEAINNPLRLLAGWFMIDAASFPPGSLIASYWMIGCYFMAIKRYSELNGLKDQERADFYRYRKSFRYYTPDRLLLSIVFYLSASMLFLGAFIMRYRMEILLAFPFVSAVLAYYLSLGFKADSAAANPEKLYREAPLVILLLISVAVMGTLFFVDIPWLHHFFAPSFRAFIQ